MDIEHTFCQEVRISNTALFALQENSICQCSYSLRGDRDGLLPPNGNDQCQAFPMQSH